MGLGDVAAVGVEEAGTGVEAGDAEREDCPAADNDDDVEVALPKITYICPRQLFLIHQKTTPCQQPNRTTKLTSRLRQLGLSNFAITTKHLQSRRILRRVTRTLCLHMSANHARELC